MQKNRALRAKEPVLGKSQIAKSKDSVVAGYVDDSGIERILVEEKLKAVTIGKISSDRQFLKGNRYKLFVINAGNAIDARGKPLDVGLYSVNKNPPLMPTFYETSRPKPITFYEGTKLAWYQRLRVCMTADEIGKQRYLMFGVDSDGDWIGLSVRSTSAWFNQASAWVAGISETAEKERIIKGEERRLITAARRVEEDRARERPGFNVESLGDMYEIRRASSTLSKLKELPSSLSLDQFLSEYRRMGEEEREIRDWSGAG